METGRGGSIRHAMAQSYPALAVPLMSSELSELTSKSEELYVCCEQYKLTSCSAYSPCFQAVLEPTAVCSSPASSLNSAAGKGEDELQQQ